MTLPVIRGNHLRSDRRASEADMVGVGAGVRGMRSGLLAAALALASAVFTEACAEENFSAPRFGCDGCAQLTAADMGYIVSELRNTSPLRAELYFFHSGATFPIQLPLRSVESGARCLMVDKGEIEQLVATVSELSVLKGEDARVEPDTEVRIYHSNSLILEAFFNDGRYGADNDGPLTAAVINGKFAIVRSAPVERIRDFVRTRLLGPHADKFCKEYRGIYGK
jgi:hypothetical protein